MSAGAEAGGIALGRKAVRVERQFPQQPPRQARAGETCVLPDMQGHRRQRCGRGDCPGHSLPAAQPAPDRHERDAGQQQGRAARVPQLERQPHVDDVDDHESPVEQRGGDVQQPDRDDEGGDARVRPGQDDAAGAMRPGEDVGGEVNRLARGMPQRGQPLAEVARPEGGADADDHEQQDADRQLVAPDVGDEDLDRVAERVAGQAEDQRPDRAAEQVHQRESRGRHADRATRDRDRDAEPVHEAREEEQEAAAALHPAADAIESGFGGSLGSEGRLPAGARELVVDLVGDHGGGRRDNQDPGEVEIAAVGQEGRREDERVALDHRPGKQHEVAVPDDRLLEHGASRRHRRFYLGRRATAGPLSPSDSPSRDASLDLTRLGWSWPVPATSRMLCLMTSRERMAIAMRLGQPDRVPVMCQLALGHYFLQSGVDPLEVWYSSEAFAEALICLQRRYGFDGILVNLPGRERDWRRRVRAIDARGGAATVRWTNGWSTVFPPDDLPWVCREDGSRFRPRFEEIDPERLFYVEPHAALGARYPFAPGFER